MATTPPPVPKPKKDAIAEKATPELEQLPFNLVEKHHNKTTLLLANSTKTKPIDGKNRWFEYEFKEFIFIYRIVIHETNYPEYSNFEIEAEISDGNIFKSRVVPSTGKVILDVNNYCRSVRFKPPPAYFSISKSIDSVEVYGFVKSDVSKFIQFARDIGTLKDSAIIEIEDREKVYQDTIQRAEQAESQVLESNKNLTSLKGHADRVKTNIRKLESERSDLTTKSEVLKDTIEKNSRELNNLRTELSSKGALKETLDSQIGTCVNDLSGLRANLDLFPSELSDFVKQGSKNIKLLFWLALLPILIIGIMFVLLIEGAADLTTKITPDKYYNVSALIVSRAPYVFISIAIITACYKISRAFITELIEINRVKLSLTKISIVAKDVSNATEFDLNLSELEKYSLRLKLKMDLLRGHLKGYVSPDFEISMPKDIVSYLPFARPDEKVKLETPDGLVNSEAPD